MTSEVTPKKQEQRQMKMVGQSSGDAVYGFGLFGAWAYYFSQATTLQEGVIGFFKGFVWPAVLVYELFKFLNKEEETKNYGT